MAETGHAKNIEHFEQRIAYATSWGAAYQPTNPLLLLTNMNSVLTPLFVADLGEIGEDFRYDVLPAKAC